MTRLLDNFPPTRSGPEWIYPWSDWMDGSIWQIRQGEDFDCKPESMITNIHSKATWYDFDARTKRLPGGRIVFQFTERPEPRRG